MADASTSSYVCVCSNHDAAAAAAGLFSPLLSGLSSLLIHTLQTPSKHLPPTMQVHMSEEEVIDLFMTLANGE